MSVGDVSAAMKPRPVDVKGGKWPSDWLRKQPKIVGRQFVCKNRQMHCEREIFCG